jgi:ATP-binding cassette subfamily F protein 3
LRRGARAQILYIIYLYCPSGDTIPDTEELRAQIEAIDEEIIDLIATRMEIADELAKAKKMSSQGYWDTDKEREVIQRYHELCEEVSLSEDEARQIAEVLLKISKERQKHFFQRYRQACPGIALLSGKAFTPAMLLKAQSIAKAFGPVKVLTDVSLQINRGDSIGLIGVNGAGKSTFLKILLGELKPDTGELTRNTERIGYLEQFAESSAEYTVRDVLGRPYGHIENIKRRLREIEDQMVAGGDIDWNALAEENAALESQLEKSDMEDEENLKAALEKVGLSADLMDRTMDSLSGGERTKVMLSRIVVQADDCDLLVMDEPTSHLDINTVEWLEDYLLKTHCSVLVISHDRYFLDKIATRMLEIDHGKSREYKGNYSDFIMKKMLDLDRMEKEYRKYAAQKRKQEEIAKQLHHDQWYLTTHKTREKLISKMEEKEKPEENREITVRIQAAHKSGKNVLTCKGLSVELGGRTILEDVDLDIHKGDKIGVFGSNGEGKSTLIKALLEQIPSKGELWVAPGAKIGYYSQHHERLDPKLTAEEQLLVVIGKERRADARQMLARFLLTGEEVERPISTLSGGQRARVAMCLLLLDQTNLLVLDEPTNYLDIPAKHAIEEALTEYDGTIITVTHDRYFLDTVCTKMIEVKDRHVRMFSGTYSEMKGRPNVKEVVMDADEYRVLSPFTNWVSGKKYAKGDRVLITPAEQKSFEWALNQGKLKKTGGRQRKKVNVQKNPEEGSH